MITLLTPSNKVSDAIKEYSAAVNAGNVEAMTYLAECYEDGLGGLEVDNTKARDLYMNAAQKGYAPAEYSIACWLDDDDDDLYNPEEAYVWIKRAAEHQYAVGQRQLHPMLVGRCGRRHVLSGAMGAGRP